jgi:mannan endo-1,4-beta-mannosidase
MKKAGEERVMSGCHLRRRVVVLALAGFLMPAWEHRALADGAGFVYVIGTQFMLRGRPIFLTGTNSYYQMVYRRWQAPGPDEVLDKVQARAMTLVRTWAFQDAVESGACLQCAPARQLQPTERPVDFLDPVTLAALDQTLAAADSRGIRLILALVNNWGDYGGMDRWTLWRFGSVQHDGFYSDATIRGWYKELASALVNRVNTVNGRLYRDDPTIFAWELANEARSSSGAAASLNAWMGEMSAYLKSIDPNHLVTTGIEGFYGPAYAARNTDSWMSLDGQDFISNHQYAGIDFATCHIWPYNWGWDPIGNTQSALNKAGQYFQQRLTDAETTLHKPLLCEEFGVPRDNMGLGIDSGPTTIRDLFHQQVYYGLCESSALIGGACGGTTNWLILHDGYSQYDDGYGVFLPSDASTDTLMTADALYMNRLRRGDLDFDGDVDQADFGIMQACLTGSTGVLPQSACRNADMNNDGHADDSDAAVFLSCMSGSEVPADPACVYAGVP